MLDIAAYLDRIAYDGPRAPTLDALRELHRAHLRTVPFENLDIGRGVPLSLDESDLFDKIVRHRRGGFCYELNGLFAALLRELGFQVTLLAAQFPRPDGRSAPYFDHLTLLVRTTDSPDPWLADVGAGRSSPVRPLRFDTADEQIEIETGTTFRIATERGRSRLFQRVVGTDWEPGYGFSVRGHALPEFATGCRYHATSPESIFTQGDICSRVTEDGRITLSGHRLITTAGDERTERELPDDDAYRSALRTYFGIELASERQKGRA